MTLVPNSIIILLPEAGGRWIGGTKIYQTITNQATQSQPPVTANPDV
jgi:hypothetical protein